MVEIASMFFLLSASNLDVLHSRVGSSLFISMPCLISKFHSTTSEGDVIKVSVVCVWGNVVEKLAPLCERKWRKGGEGWEKVF